MIKSKTYSGTAGLNYIQDPELAFATIYVVKREGTQHDKYISGSANRTHIHDSSTGKISFPNTFNPLERVFVLYKTGNGVEPPTPPGVCVPVGVPGDGLPNGVVGQTYNYTIYLTGTTPIVVTPTSIPAWMTLTSSASSVLLTGTPTTEQTETVQFTVENCSGSSANFNQSFSVTDPTAVMTIYNNTVSGVFITSIGGISYTIQTGSLPIGNGQSMAVVHPAYTGVIGVGISGVVFSYSLKLYKNAVLLETLPVTGSGGYIFASQTYLTSDVIEIILQ